MNRAQRNLLALLAIAALSAVAGCSTTPTVQRISPDQVTDVSGYWNDTDANLTAQQMINQMLGDPWLGNYERGHGGQQPTVIVGEIRNLSSEHISVSTFIDDMQRELINSGKVQFVASSSQRGEVRDERQDQDLNASEATRSAMGQEVGADYMMQGTINTIIDAAGDKAVKYYQVDLKLINMHNNVIAWLGQKKIKKLVSRSGYRP
ncbi:MAG TPA: penicillin-binding protein activator LpoB [Gammaproteobacteria bacterium]|nr:penicillin-binding protein activator LpoB [Gammaproteobacteria bacterium]